MHSFPVFFRGEKDFSILDALHFFHTLEVFLELFGAEVVLVYKSTLVDVCFLLTRLVQSSSFVAVIDACQSVLVLTVMSILILSLFTQHTFSIPLTYLFKASCSHYLSLFLLFIYTFPIFSQNFLFSLILTLSVYLMFFVSYLFHICLELPTLSYELSDFI